MSRHDLPLCSPTATRRQFLQTVGAGAALASLGNVGFAAAKLPLKLGLASYSTRKFTLDQTIDMAKECGLGYLCLKSMHLPLEAKPDEIKAAAAKVKQAGLVLYGCGVVSMRKEEQVQQAFDYAKAAGMTVIVAMPEPAMLPVIEKAVKKYDVIRVAIHNHGPGDKIWPTSDVIMEKIAGLDKRIGLCIDIGHTVRVGADLLALTKKFADRIHDVHVKDVTEATPKGKSTICGRGIIDLAGFLRVLIATKYPGVVSFEYEDEPDHPLPGLKASVEHVQDLLKKM